MKLENGNLQVGDIVWVCDFRHNDIFKKPIRHVSPTKVRVTYNDDLPKRKRVYYSKTHFRKLNSKGEIMATVIAPFDNTGYRTYTGTCLNIFDNEKECIEYYNKQCQKILEQIDEGRNESEERFNRMFENILSKVIK